MFRAIIIMDGNKLEQDFPTKREAEIWVDENLPKEALESFLNPETEEEGLILKKPVFQNLQVSIEDMTPSEEKDIQTIISQKKLNRAILEKELGNPAPLNELALEYDRIKKKHSKK